MQIGMIDMLCLAHGVLTVYCHAVYLSLGYLGFLVASKVLGL